MARTTGPRPTLHRDRCARMLTQLQRQESLIRDLIEEIVEYDLDDPWMLSQLSSVEGELCQLKHDLFDQAAADYPGFTSPASVQIVPADERDDAVEEYDA